MFFYYTKSTDGITNSTEIEKLNDVAKQSYFSSCKWNPTEEIMQTAKDDKLIHYCAGRQDNTKKDHEYWPRRRHKE